jgi:hypothetical protein
MMNGKHSMQLTLAVAVVSGALAASTAFAQYSSPTAPSTQPSATGTTATPPSTTPSTPPATSMDKGTSSPTAMTPSKTEMSSSAFTKLDAGKRGYVTKADVAQLQGFDSAFQQADTNNDGKLSKDEFDRAWAIYSGQK